MGDLLDLTVEIVSAHVATNAIEGEHLPALIRSVYDALAGSGEPEAAETTFKPAVPVKQSVFDDRVVCLACGKSFRVLKRHLHIDHGLNPEDYRQRFGLPRSYPLVAPEYAETRARVARESGLGRSGGRRKRKKNP